MKFRNLNLPIMKHLCFSQSYNVFMLSLKTIVIKKNGRSQPDFHVLQSWLWLFRRQRLERGRVWICPSSSEICFLKKIFRYFKRFINAVKSSDFTNFSIFLFGCDIFVKLFWMMLNFMNLNYQKETACLKALLLK